MSRLLVSLVIATSLSATWIAAHSGVTNPAVMERMQSMKQQQAAVKTLGSMAKGETPFDPAEARSAAVALAEEAARTAALFKAQETDPKTEALPVIWEQFADFEQKATAFEDVAQGVVGSVQTPEALTQSLARIGAACKDCHQTYRK